MEMLRLSNFLKINYDPTIFDYYHSQESKNTASTGKTTIGNQLAVILKEMDYSVINTTLTECIRRDIKGHDRQAQSGTINNFTGIGSPFEEPSSTDLVIKTSYQSINESVKRCLDFSLIAFLDPFEPVR